MNVRRVCFGLIASAALAGVVSCGGSDDPAPPVTYTVGGTLSGSVGTVVLRLNGAGDLSLAAPGSFTFPAGIGIGAAYDVTAAGAQNCSVAGGTGTMGSSNVTNVAITCTTVVRAASLTGAQENPANPSTATGRGAVTVNPTTKEITGGITFSGLTPTAHHIHQAPTGNPGGNGGVVVGLTLATGGGAATVPAGTVLTDAQYAALLAGELYFNVHSAAYPGGEIRGQITVRTGITAGLATLSGANESPANASTATGRGTLVVDATTREVLTGVVTFTGFTPTAHHIHQAPAGTPTQNGPVAIGLTLGTNGLTATVPLGTTLTAAQYTALLAGELYFNVHSATYPGGEIRGQIGVQ
jgi:hypothetical protein